MIPPEIKNIIFDLGGVIINLSVDATVERFTKLTGLNEKVVRQKLLKSDLFKEHEKGAISDKDFRNAIRTTFQIKSTDEEIDESWNEMLGDIPVERIKLLLYLKNRYRLFLLSNTNEIHFLRVTEILHAVDGNPTFENLFEKVYYSHRLNMRKPDKQIFEHVLHENGLIATETLFLDDNLENLAGAELAGIRTFHVEDPESLFPLFEFKK